MSAVTESQKEQAKLTATYINGIAITVFALGCASPLIAGVFGTSPRSQPSLNISLVPLICLVMSLGLHWLARRVLRRGLGG